MIKRGELRGVLLGNRWHVRRSEWARYMAKLEAEQAAKLPAETAPANDAASSKEDLEADADAVLAELGLERRSAGRRRGR